MKANEAPENVYLALNAFGDIIKDQWQFHRLRDDDIEYTRTDAFIEKTCKFLRNNLEGYDLEEEDKERIIEDFKAVMKYGYT